VEFLGQSISNYKCLRLQHVKYVSHVFFAREALAKKIMWNRSMLGLTGLVWGIFEWKHVLFWKWWSGSCRCSPIRREITLGIYCNIFEVRLVGPSPWLQLCWMWTVSMWL
jgi:hypothetical protein